MQFFTNIQCPHCYCNIDVYVNRNTRNAYKTNCCDKEIIVEHKTIIREKFSVVKKEKGATSESK